MMWDQVIAPLLTALVLLASAAGVGLAVFAAAGARGTRHSGFEVALAPALGLGVLGYVADLLFMTGGLGMRPIYMAMAAIGLGLLAWRLPHLPKRVAGARTPWLDRLLWTAGWSVVLWFGLKLVIGNITQVNDNDAIYHYAFYSRLLSSGATFDQILLLRNFPATDLNRIIQHVFAMGGTLGGESALHLVNFLFILSMALVGQAVSVAVLGVSRWGNPLPILAILSLREIIYTGFTAKLDYGVAVFELLAAALFLTWRDRARWILPLGLGLALCARTNSLRFAAVIPLLWILDQIWSRAQTGGWAGIFRRTALVGVASIVVTAPPYAMQQYIYGNPVFPMLNGMFGEYAHYYDWVMFESLQYRTEYGWLGAPAVYAAVALKNIWIVPGVVPPGNTAWGLSALMLLAPLAIRRDRATLWLLGFVVLGFATWYEQLNTHRTLLSVAVVAVLLAAALISRMRARLAPLHVVLFLGVGGLASWSAYDFLTINNLVFNYNYVKGMWSRDEYHDLMVRRLYPGVIPTAEETRAIAAIVGDRHMASINLTPFAHPDLIRTRRLMTSPDSLEKIAADEKADASDRRIARELLESPFIAQQARDVSERLWPADGVQRPLAGSADLRWYLTASHDAWRQVGDAIVADPSRLAPMLRFENVAYVLAPAASVFGTSPVGGLTEVWRSAAYVLLRVEDR